MNRSFVLGFMYIGVYSLIFDMLLFTVFLRNASQSKSMNTGETSRPKRKRPSKKVQMQEKDYDVSISEQVLNFVILFTTSFILFFSSLLNLV